MELAVVPALTPARAEGVLLMLLRQTGDEVGVAGSDAIILEGLGYFGDKLQEQETGIDMVCALAGLGGNRIVDFGVHTK